MRALAPCSCQGRLWVPACEAVIQFRISHLFALCSSFPRKREPRDFSHLPPVHARGRLWAPAFAGATIGECCRFDYSLLRGDDEQGGVSCANFRNEVLVRPCHTFTARA